MVYTPNMLRNLENSWKSVRIEPRTWKSVKILSPGWPRLDFIGPGGPELKKNKVYCRFEKIDITYKIIYKYIKYITFLNHGKHRSTHPHPTTHARPKKNKFVTNINKHLYARAYIYIYIYICYVLRLFYMYIYLFKSTIHPCFFFYTKQFVCDFSCSGMCMCKGTK